MKFNKTVIAVLATVLFSCAFAGAQQVGPSHGTPPAHFQNHKHAGFGNLIKELGLNPGQTNKIKAIMGTQRSKMMELRKNTTLTPEQKKADMKQIRSHARAEMMKVLSPTQRTKFKQIMQNHGKKAPAKP